MKVCIYLSVSYKVCKGDVALSARVHRPNKELNLLKALYKNKKLTELPLQIGVTINTLRTHLQSIFRKTQTNSQVELMIRLSMYKI